MEVTGKTKVLTTAENKQADSLMLITGLTRCTGQVAAYSIYNMMHGHTWKYIAFVSLFHLKRIWFISAIVDGIY